MAALFEFSNRFPLQFIQVTECSQETLDTFLNYFRNGFLDLTFKNIRFLLDFALRCRKNDIITLCTQYIKREMTLDQAFVILMDCLRHEDSLLCKTISYIIRKCSVPAFYNPSFLEKPGEMLIRVLKSSHLAIEEIAIINFCVLWLKKDPSARCVYFSQIINGIHFQLLLPDQLLELYSLLAHHLTRPQIIESTKISQHIHSYLMRDISPLAGGIGQLCDGKVIENISTKMRALELTWKFDAPSMDFNGFYTSPPVTLPRIGTFYFILTFSKENQFSLKMFRLIQGPHLIDSVLFKVDHEELKISFLSKNTFQPLPIVPFYKEENGLIFQCKEDILNPLLSYIDEFGECQLKISYNFKV
jgi:hypothetical protein